MRDATPALGGPPARLRPLRWPDDRPALETLDLSFTTGHVFEVRRGPLSFALVATAAGPGRRDAGPGEHRMATFVLIHGAWHGGWCWRRLTPLLRDARHDVYTPTLTGLGERAHLLSPDVGLGTHAQDVVGVLWYEDLRDIILVGHSYGGMVITVTTELVTERVADLIYLDAFVPRGKAMRVAGASTPATTQVHGTGRLRDRSLHGPVRQRNLW